MKLDNVLITLSGFLLGCIIGAFIVADLCILVTMLVPGATVFFPFNFLGGAIYA